MKLYHVHLTAEQDQTLRRLIHTGQAPAPVQTRARILLAAATGQPDDAIAHALLSSRPTVQRTRQRFAQQGLDAALYDAPRRGRPPRLTGEVEATLTMLACSAAPAGHARWTLQLLADRLVELQVVATISPSAVHGLLKKTR